MNSEYYKGFIQALNTIDLNAVKQAALRIKNSERVFIGGNGGSAAISNHAACDLQKGLGIQVQSLSANAPLITAIANDCGYENTLLHQLQAQDLTPYDTIILVSSSGTSPNIVKAAAWAYSQRHDLIGISGFTGGTLKSYSTLSLHVQSDDYGHVECAHQHILHTIAHLIKNNLTL